MLFIHTVKEELMKILCFSVNGEARLGAKLDKGIVDLTAMGYDKSLLQTITGCADAKKEIQALLGREDLKFVDETGIDFLPPASDSSKVLCVGLNYKLHVDEGRRGEATGQYPETPVLFAKFHNALNAHNKAFKVMPGSSRFDYEAELVVVMGKGGMDIPKEKALEYVFGYTCGNDISARDAQRMSSQWLIGKSFPGSAPVGPWIVTADELDASRLEISCRRGDTVVQSSNTDQMIFDIPTIISFASKFIRLEPGDLILTGTPNGVISGYPADQQKWMSPGEVITVSIEGIGDLVTPFV